MNKQEKSRMTGSDWWFYGLVVLAATTPSTILVAVMVFTDNLPFRIIVGAASLLVTILLVVYATRNLLTSADKSRKQLEEIQSNLEEQNVELVRNTLTMIEYRNQLEDRHEELQQAKRDLEKQNFTLVQNARSLTKYRQQLEARNVALQEALDKTKQLSDYLASEKEKMETLLQSLSDGVFAVDEKQQVLLFNKAAEHITKLNKDQVIGKPVDEVLQFYHHKERLMLREYSSQTEEVKDLMRKTGLALKIVNGEVFVSLTAAPVMFEGQEKSGWIVTFHDITKERQLEAMKLDFVSMAAHELRTPLTTMQGYLSMLQVPDSLKKLNEEEQMFIDKAIASAVRLNELIENLLAVSKIEKGDVPLQFKDVQMEELYRKVFEESESLAQKKGLKLIYTPPSEPLPKIEADSSRIEEVLINLVGNAVKYTDKGQIEISSKLENNQVITSVSDTGVGIPQEAIPRLFTKFFRVKGSLVELGAKGTGLGLYISKNIINAHGGRIWVESEEGKGSTFSFSLPLKRDKGAKPKLAGLPAKNSS